MTPRKRKSRVYWRAQGGARRAWFDGRDYADVGGTREPLIASGESFATMDPDLAAHLAAERLAKLQSARERRAFAGGRAVETQLDAFARLHLAAKQRSGKITDERLAIAGLALERAITYFGRERELGQIRVSDIRAWIIWLEALTTPRKRRLGAGTIRHHLNALSNLYRRAQEEEIVLPGYNPVAALMEKPAGPRREARWIEIHDAALLLEAARQLRPLGGTTLDADTMERLRSECHEGRHASLRAAGRAFGVSDVVVVGRILRGEQPATLPVDDAAHAEVLVATFLLTGCRFREVAGLELDDVSFDRKTVTIRPNRWRALKTRTSHRVIPLWPQLESILRAWVFGPRLERGGSLLFPSWTAKGERRLQDIHRLLDRVAKRAGLGAGELRSKAFRHTYCAARLQTLDRGAPVSIYTVARELGLAPTRW